MDIQHSQSWRIFSCKLTIVGQHKGRSCSSCREDSVSFLATLQGMLNCPMHYPVCCQESKAKVIWTMWLNTIGLGCSLMMLKFWVLTLVPWGPSHPTSVNTILCPFPIYLFPTYFGLNFRHSDLGTDIIVLNLSLSLQIWWLHTDFRVYNICILSLTLTGSSSTLRL